MGFFLPRVLELHARALKLRQPVPVDPKVLSMRRSAGMVAAALPRLEIVTATTFFKAVLAVVAAVSACL